MITATSESWMSLALVGSVAIWPVMVWAGMVWGHMQAEDERE